MKKHPSSDDALCNVLLKSIAHAITGALVKLINASMVKGVFPEPLAVVKFIPLCEKMIKGGVN